MGGGRSDDYPCQQNKWTSLYENVCCCFGVLIEILSDRELGFRGNLVGELMEKLGFACHYSIPYYPQCNGLVENLNEMIAKIINQASTKEAKGLGPASTSHLMVLMDLIEDFLGIKTIPFGF